MAEKTYRPKASAEGLKLTFPNPQTGETVDIEEWPYSTSDPTEQTFLDSYPLVTDRPESKKGE